MNQQERPDRLAQVGIPEAIYNHGKKLVDAVRQTLRGLEHPSYSLEKPAELRQLLNQTLGAVLSKFLPDSADEMLYEQNLEEHASEIVEKVMEEWKKNLASYIGEKLLISNPSVTTSDRHVCPTEGDTVIVKGVDIKPYKVAGYVDPIRQPSSWEILKGMISIFGGKYEDGYLGTLVCDQETVGGIHWEHSPPELVNNHYVATPGKSFVPEPGERNYKLSALTHITKLSK